MNLVVWRAPHVFLTGGCGSKSQGKKALVTFLLKALQQNAILNAAS